MSAILSRRRKLFNALAHLDLESFQETFDISDERMCDLIRMMGEYKQWKKNVDAAYYQKHREKVLARVDSHKDEYKARKLELARERMKDPAYREKMNAYSRMRYQQRIQNDPEFRAHRQEMQRKRREAKRRAQLEQGENI